MLLAKILHHLESFVVLLLLLVQNLAVVPVTVLRFRPLKYLIPLLVLAQNGLDVLFYRVKFLHKRERVRLI